MKPDVHPKNYRLVVFKDTSCDYTFLTKSTVETKEVITAWSKFFVKLRTPKPAV